MPSAADFQGKKPTWCPGCGNFLIIKTFKEALVDLGLAPHQLTVVTGIGQAAKLPHYMKCNMFNGLHGRAIPLATGFKLASREMPVFVFMGDGDALAEGGNHFMHGIRRNASLKCFIHNNMVYGLTKGQASPTTFEGTPNKNSPFGVIEGEVNPVALAITLNCSFVARTFAGDAAHMKQMMIEAYRHPGLTYVDILQPCVTFNTINTFEWYRQRCYHLEGSYDPTDRFGAIKRAFEWGDKIPLGVLYKTDRGAFEDKIPVLAGEPLHRRTPPPEEKIRATLERWR